MKMSFTRIFCAVFICAVLVSILQSCHPGQIDTSTKCTMILGDSVINCSLNSKSFNVGEVLVLKLDSNDAPKCAITFDGVLQTYVTEYPFTFSKTLNEKGEHTIAIGIAPLTLVTPGVAIELTSSTGIGIYVK